MSYIYEKSSDLENNNSNLNKTLYILVHFYVMYNNTITWLSSSVKYSALENYRNAFRSYLIQVRLTYVFVTLHAYVLKFLVWSKLITPTYISLCARLILCFCRIISKGFWLPVITFHKYGAASYFRCTSLIHIWFCISAMPTAYMKLIVFCVIFDSNEDARNSM